MLDLVFYGMSIIIFIILIKWVLHNMSSIENKTKTVYLIIGIILVLILSFILFNVSKVKIDYPNEEVFKQIRKWLLAIFIPMNGLVILPYIANLIEKVKLEEIENEELKKRAILFAVILIILIIFECKYLTNAQLGILTFFHK